MKKSLIALCVFLAAGMTVSAQVAGKSSKEESKKVWYTCPMHPHEMSIKDGECSKCGMKMVKYKGAIYTCPMHPQEMVIKKGKCPVCGMKMVEANKTKDGSKIKGGSASSTAAPKYICKMDGSTSDKPGKCPKCGMNMTKVESDKEEEHHSH